MGRLGRITDYGLMVLIRMARAPEAWYSARVLAESLALPQPTVGKILKLLHRGKLVHSQRGALGGYQLAVHPEELTLSRIITVLEGAYALVACSSALGGHCDRMSDCAVAPGLLQVDRKVRGLLEEVSLATLAHPSLTAANAA
ncbi:MAG: Rrf2 family transcriptional regulator [Magnetococcales bacterium]|nr:Rrf2 family transcriptional regulator [Magnetococcales bacterium]